MGLSFLRPRLSTVGHVYQIVNQILTFGNLMTCVSWEHKTNDGVRSEISFLVGPRELLLATVKRRNLAWFGHVTRRNSPSKPILRDILKGGRRRGREKKCWMDNIKIEYPCLCQDCSKGLFAAGKDWKRISAESSLISHRRSNR